MVKAGVTHQQRRAVVAGQLSAPAGIQAHTLGVPGGLTDIKVSRAVLADLVRDKVCPGHGVAEVTLAVCNCGDKHGFGQSIGSIAVEQGQSVNQFIASTVRFGIGNGALQMVSCQSPSLPLCSVKRTRHDQRRARQLAQLSGCLRNRLLDKAPVRVDSNKLIQRPGRGDALAGLCHAGLQPGKVKRRTGFFNNGIHLATPEELGVILWVSLAGQMRKVMRVNHSSRYSPA